MRYKITHTTKYSYEKAVAVCHNLVLLTPREGALQTCRNPAVRVTPTPTVMARRKDAFGNVVHAFSIEHAHMELSIHASSHVEVRSPGPWDAGSTPPWPQVSDSIRSGSDPAWPAVAEYLIDSPKVARDPSISAYAREIAASVSTIGDLLLALTRRTYEDFTYAPGTTDVTTTSTEAFRLRKGVCQDLAHVQIACARSLGLPARYVSGYLRTIPPPGEKRLIGADQSHAWLSIYSGPTLGWVDVDPTNNLVCRTDHVALAWGRDYGDVAPVRGVFLGGGGSKLSVSVDVEPRSN